MADDDGYEQGDEDNINYKSISCEQIPELFLDKLVAKKHFSKFGKINRFILRPSRFCCTVDYETEQDAANAYEKAGNYNGYEFLVNFSEKEVGHVQNTEEWVDPDVQDELDAMGRSAANSQMRQVFMKPQMPPPQRLSKPVAQKAARSFAPPPTPVQVTEPETLPKVDTSVRMELEAALRKPAYTDEEKYRVLDARDKLIRLTTVRQTDIKKAVSAKGICPDMCPEKERLMREFQRQVATFESNNGSNSTINHRRAIKEYSRSSADQEVPLAHELRAENVLQLTMLYLMHSILDLCDDPQTSLADWFHFVWDRTRSIRKDITQQELCSLGAVQLVEQCARFHIHCAARLVAEDPSVFDKKINAENLTKCLQTLKYMYHDLRIKRVRCPCEAEFRGYIVLLNLGDANFLWELKQLPEEIQNSAHIKRAIAFYNALQNNNYVRFFNMIRAEETNYLSACILLGYFTRLRLKAMEAIVKSYTWRKNPAWLPLDYLTRVLGFEDVEAAIDFFSSHGLQCDDGRVKLDRLSMPDLEYCMDRALLLVESKRNVSVGECVCGHPLQSAKALENYQPHNSFDNNGLLKPEAWSADDQLRGEAAVKRLKQLQQKPQQLSTTAAARSVLQPPPILQSTESIFKVPLATPPLTSKHQHKQLQQEQNGAKSTSTSSIFSGNQFVQERNATPAGKATSNSIFSMPTVPQIKSTTSLFGPYSESSPTTDAGASLFKIPLGSGSVAQKPTEASSATAFFNSRFMPVEKPPIPADIFGGFAKKSPPKPTSSGNIFGAAAKETANIFQQQPTAPKPMPTDNIFKHFQTTTPDFAAPLKPNTNIFGSASAKTATVLQKLPASAISETNKTVEHTLARKRQLEEEQRRNLAELEEERRKLKALEEKHARLREEAERKRHLEAFHRKSEQVSQNLIETLLKEEICQVAADELELYHALERRTLELTLELMDETVLAEVQEIQNEEYALMCHDQLILHRYFDRWLQSTRKKLKQRKLMETTPIWATTETRAQHSEQIQHPRQAENLKMIKRYRHGEPCNFKLLLSPAAGARGGIQLPIDIFQLISQQSKRRKTQKNGIVQQRKYFKLLLTLPGDREELYGFEGMCHHWLQKYLRQPLPQANDKSYINGVAHDVALCVRKLTGMLPTNEAGHRVLNHESDNADGIICLMTGDNLRNTRRRLHYLLKLSKLYKPVPIGLVVYNANMDDRELASCLELESFMDEDVVKVSNFKIFGCQESKNDFNFYSNFKRAVRFVARESSFNNTESEALEMQRFQSWLEAALGEPMWQRWQEASLQNPIFNKICTMPRFVVDLYNESLQRLQEIVGEDFQEAPEFPEELREFVPSLKYDIPLGLEHFPIDWKSSQRCEKLSAFLSSLQLHPLQELQLSVEADIDDLELCLLNYSSLCIPMDDEMATKAAFQSIKALIDALNNPDLHDLKMSKRLSTINWLAVIKPLAFTLINHKLQNAGSMLPAEIIYRSQRFSDYQQLPWWFNIKPMTAVTVDYTLADDPTDDKTIDSETREDVAAFIEQAEEASLKAEQNLHILKQKTNKTLNDELTRELDESLYQFDVAKNAGSFITILPDDDDLDEVVSDDDEVLDGHRKKLSPQGKKRKIDEPVSELDSIIARAFALIEKVETKQDYLRSRKTARQCTDF